MRILALTRYGMSAATTRQRFRLYEPALKQAGIHVDYAPFFDDSHVSRLVEGRRHPLLPTAAAYVRRLRTLTGAGRYDLLWVQYELFPYLPGWFERLGLNGGRPLLVDNDDAIFHKYDGSPHGLVRRMLSDKLVPLLRVADGVCCGNQYLRAYAARYCPNSIVLPTVVDTERYQPRSRSDGPPVIGWIGSPTTWPNVRPLLGLLRELAAAYGVRFSVVGAGRAAEQDRFDGMDLIEWREEREIADVQAMDIGIMPLDDTPFQRGKCGYKLIQYMACGLPVVASPVGVNSEIVEHGANGFLATSVNEWRVVLERLIGNAELRRRLGDEGRRRAVDHYSLQAQAPALVAMIQALPAAHAERIAAR